MEVEEGDALASHKAKMHPAPYGWYSSRIVFYNSPKDYRIITHFVRISSPSPVISR